MREGFSDLVLMRILVARSSVYSLFDIIFVLIVIFILTRNYLLFHFFLNTIFVRRIIEIFQIIEIFGESEVVKKVPAVRVFRIIHSSHFFVSHFIDLVVVGNCVYFYLIIEVGSRFDSIHPWDCCFFQHQVCKESCVINFFSCSCSFRVILYQWANNGWLEIEDEPCLILDLFNGDTELSQSFSIILSFLVPKFESASIGISIFSITFDDLIELRRSDNTILLKNNLLVVIDFRVIFIFNIRIKNWPTHDFYAITFIIG